MAGRTVVMLCRNVAAGNALRAEIIGAGTQRAAIHVVHCDLASLAAVRKRRAMRAPHVRPRSTC